MNSLNIISSRVSPTPTPIPSRSNSISALGIAAPAQSDNRTVEEESFLNTGPDSQQQSNPHGAGLSSGPRLDSKASVSEMPGREGASESAGSGMTEETSLLPRVDEKPGALSAWLTVPRRLGAALMASLRWMLSALAGPSVYLWTCLCDEGGNFVPIVQLRTFLGLGARGRIPKLAVNALETTTDEDRPTSGTNSANLGKRHFSSVSASSSSSLSEESEADRQMGKKRDGSSLASAKRRSRSGSLQGPPEGGGPSQRSIRIKLHEGGQKKHRKNSSVASRGSRASKAGRDSLTTPDISAQLKSPTSPISALTKYPKTPAPPRPLIPRDSSYVNYESTTREGQKTLILDLDETLIHSMSKGGRMGTGHMVEVRLSTSYVGAGGQTTVSPQHPILYFVFKRPHCDEFLRRVQKWYNLVIFTASVQEYADPVIDWLEADRPIFSKRYYRQHCTFRHGAFIKDLSSVEPDMSKVMILDNSPLSYMFHPDNAIPIQGWINDPTDNDLLNLVPFLEGLQYVSDVRALLALRGGEDGQHMTM